MKPPRISIAWLMFLVAMLGVTLALVQTAMSGHPILGGNALFNMGLWPSLLAFGSATFAIFKGRGTGSPFLRGFAVVGWSTVAVYLAIWAAYPQLLQRVVVYYLNDIDYWWIVWLIDADTYEGYAASLLVLGLILATPCLIMATLGGLVARWTWGKRWTTT